MPRFFFHVSDGTTVPDPQGEQCETLSQAREVADLIALRLGQERPTIQNKGLFIVVTDEGGREVHRVPLAKLQS
jgi:hypothetical protein